MTAAIILGGAHVWNEDSFDSLCPRLLLPIANLPIASYTLGWLKNAGVRRVILCANEADCLLERCFGDGSEQGLDLDFYIDRMPRGPAGCTHDASDIAAAEQYVVVEAAIIPGVHLRTLLAFHAASRAAATIVVNPTPSDQAGTTQAFAEQASPAGVYVFARHALGRVPPTSYQDIKEMLIPRLHRDALVIATYPGEEPSPRVSGLASYLAVQGWMLARLREQRSAPETYAWHEESCVHSSARIAKSARLLGLVMVGPGARVGEEAIVIGPTVIGSQCVLSGRCVVGRSVLWDGGSVGRAAQIDQCLVTTGAAVAPETASHSVILRATLPARSA